MKQLIHFPDSTTAECEVAYHEDGDHWMIVIDEKGREHICELRHDEWHAMPSGDVLSLIKTNAEEIKALNATLTEVDLLVAAKNRAATAAELAEEDSELAEQMERIEVDSIARHVARVI